MDRTATALPSAEQAEVAQECRDELSRGATGMDGTPSAEQLLATDLVLADTRGAYSYGVLSGADGLEATCLIERGSVLGLFERWGSMAGSYGFLTPPTPDVDRVVGTVLMAMGGSGEGSAWSTEGHVGAEVLAVTVTTDSGTEVEMTVTNGRFTGWWPQRLSIDDTGGLAQVRYVVTLRDGTVLAPRPTTGSPHSRRTSRRAAAYTDDSGAHLRRWRRCRSRMRWLGGQPVAQFS